MTDPDRTRAVSALIPRLRRRAPRFAASIEAAEDLAQEALLRVWIRLARDRDEVADLDADLFTTLRNLARRQRPGDAELTEAEMPRTDSAAETRLATTEVLVALSHLPPKQATLILDHAVDGVSYAELARRHRVPIGTVMSRVARGRARLSVRFDLKTNRPVAELLGRR